jgi:hypothetical protein
MASEVVEELKRIREETLVPEGFPETDLTIDELPDFKSITDFNEDSDIVAVVSHPGWKSHHRCSDEKYGQLLSLWVEEMNHEVPESNGKFRSVILAAHDIAIPEAFPSVKQNLLENELFRYLRFKNIPTIVTVPAIPYVKNSGDVKKHIEESVRESKDFVEIFNFILAQERFVLSTTLSEDFPDYLRDVREDRDNFYVISTDYEPNHEDEGLACGEIMGDYNFRNLEREVPTSFLEAVDGKKILFAGSNILGCVTSNLGYFRYVDSEVTILLNYCGASGDVDFGNFEDYVSKSGFSEYVRSHPQTSLVTQKMLNLYEEALISIEETTNRNPFYQTSHHSKMLPYAGYVQDLDLENL